MPIVVDKSDTKVHINSPLNHIPIDHALNINHLASKIFYQQLGLYCLFNFLENKY